MTEKINKIIIYTYIFVYRYTYGPLSTIASIRDCHSESTYFCSSSEVALRLRSVCVSSVTPIFSAFPPQSGGIPCSSIDILAYLLFQSVTCCSVMCPNDVPVAAMISGCHRSVTIPRFDGVCCCSETKLLCDPKPLHSDTKKWLQIGNDFPYKTCIFSMNSSHRLSHQQLLHG